MAINAFYRERLYMTVGPVSGQVPGVEVLENVYWVAVMIKELKLSCHNGYI